MSDLRARFEGMSTAQLQEVSSSADYRPEARQLAAEILSVRTTAKPTTACPAHPAMQVSGTCSRCGTFICVECDSSLARTGSGRCPGCSARVIGEPKVTSGIPLVTAALVLAAIAHGWGFALNLSSIGGAYRVTLVYMGINALLGALAVIAALRLAARHLTARRWVNLACAGEALAAVVAALASTWSPRMLFLPVCLLAGALYLTLSRRARAALAASPSPLQGDGAR
jgi:DNA-directed RNA polymerase subunit RPC12/RpoP